MKILKTCILFLLPAGLIMAASCSQPSAPGTPLQKKPTPAPPRVEVPKPNPPVPAARPTPRPRQQPTPKPEPDWEAMYQETKEKYVGKFTEPDKLSKQTLKLLTGSSHDGVLINLEDQKVSIRSEKAILTFERQQLHTSTRIKLWAEDYAIYTAKQLVKAKKDRYDKKKQLADRKHAHAKNQIAQSDAQQTVMNYLKGSLMFPESTVYLQWFPVESNDKGSQLRVKYKTKTKSFGMITERKVFFLDERGRVYQVAGYKEAS